jgi:Leucine-rich repeat (LRR) protein
MIKNGNSKLKELSLDYNQVADVSPLGELINVKKLSLCGMPCLQD